MKNEAAAALWPNTKVIGSLSKKASSAIGRQCHSDEAPWLILTSAGGAGSLVAFDDRLAIVKTGGMTGLMAGSLGGERTATFHYVDITGIEYNSGIVTGVLQVLTPSYQGTSNNDFWRGTTKSRNADAGDPWTLSNTLPLLKSEHRAAEAELRDLRERIAVAKRPAQAQSAGGLAEQIEKLNALRSSGALTDEEFAAAKARLLA